MATNRDKHVPCVHRLILSSSLFFSLVLSAMHPVRKKHDEHGKYRKCPTLDMFQQGRVNDVVSPPKFTNWRQWYFHSAPEVGILQYQKHAGSACTHLEGSYISRNNRKENRTLNFQPSPIYTSKSWSLPSSFNDLNGKKQIHSYLKGAFFSCSPPINQPTRTHRS